jgi:hypothetical protein
MTQMQRYAAALVTVALSALVAGCQTEDPQAVPGDPEAPFQESVMGVNARIGDILLRSVHIDAPADGSRYRPGDDARLWFTAINEDPTPDVLRSVTSTAADDAQIRWDADCDGRAQQVPALTLQPVPPGPAASSAGAPAFDRYFARLIDFRNPIPSGTTIPVTFSFDRAGAITLEVPVQPGNAVRPEPSNRCAEEPAVTQPSPMNGRTVDPVG